MSVLEQLVQLSEVGYLDQKIREISAKKHALPHKADEAKRKSDVSAQKEKELSVKHAELLARRRQLDQDLATEKGNLRKWEARAEKIRGEREYTALASEIGGQKRMISNVETKILETMEEMEKVEKELAAAKSSLASTNAIAAEELEKVKDDIALLESQLQETQKSRDTAIQKVPPMLQKRYDQIASKRAGVGIALIEGEVCKACRRTLPPEQCIRVAKGEAIEQCPSCQRILVTPNMSHVASSTEESAS